MANLAIDIGNTRIKWGLFEEGQLLTTGITGLGDLEKLLEGPNNQALKNIILCNVGNELDAALKKTAPGKFLLCLPGCKYAAAF